MPIYEFKCEECGNVFEHIFQWEQAEQPEGCPQCRRHNFQRVFSIPTIRMDSDVILKSLPDPAPPLEELRGKTRKGCVGGFEDKPYADPQLKNYNRTKDKNGNINWEEKKKIYFTGQAKRKSSGE